MTDSPDWLSLWIPGVPVSQQRVRCTCVRLGRKYVARAYPGHRRAGSPAALAETRWRAAIHDAGVKHGKDVRQDPALFAAPFELWAAFRIPRPKSHWRTGRYAHLLKPSAPRWWDTSTSPMDLDNLLKLVLDELQVGRGGKGAKWALWKDDRQAVAYGRCVLRWSDRPDTVEQGRDGPGLSLNVRHLADVPDSGRSEIPGDSL